MSSSDAFAPPIDLEKLQKDIHTALKRRRHSGPPTPLADLKVIQVIQSSQNLSLRAAERIVLDEALEQLHQEYPLHSELLRLHFIEGETMAKARSVGNWAESTAYKEQTFALKRLTEIILAAENRLYRDIETRFLQRVSPAATGKVFGLEKSIARLRELLFANEEHPILLVEGVGGIGKTTLAEQLVLKTTLEGAVTDFGWVSAQTSRFASDGSIRPLTDPLRTTSALLHSLANQMLGDGDWTPQVTTLDRLLLLLQEHLENGSHLLVFDNLETLEDLETLLPSLRRLSQVAQILLTSRVSLPAEPDIYHYRVQELDRADAQRLVECETKTRGIQEWGQASEDEFSALYDVVGGNPLALKLVIGQLRYHGLFDILADLKSARGKSIKELYHFIYRSAWEQLDDASRAVLLAMPLIFPRPGNIEPILHATGLSEEATRDALINLVNLNLVDRRGDLRHSTYTIHSLTRSFLEEQILQWQ